VRVLLDESVPRRLARQIQDHEVRSVHDVGWRGLKNGALLRAAQDQFDALITVDRSLPFQQNLSKYDIAVVILAAKSNRLADLEPLLPDLQRVLSEIGPSEWILIGSIRPPES